MWSEKQVKDTASAQGQDTEGAKQSRLVDLMTRVRDLCNSVYQNNLHWMAKFALAHLAKAIYPSKELTAQRDREKIFNVNPNKSWNLFNSRRLRIPFGRITAIYSRQNTKKDFCSYKQILIATVEILQRTKRTVSICTKK